MAEHSEAPPQALITDKVINENPEFIFAQIVTNVFFNVVELLYFSHNILILSCLYGFLI